MSTTKIIQETVQEDRLKRLTLEVFGQTAQPIPEYLFHPRRKWRFDFAYESQLLAVEIDGGIWTNGRHTRGSGRIGDMEKFNAAATLGWRILYATPQNVCSPKFLALVREALLWSVGERVGERMPPIATESPTGPTEGRGRREDGERTEPPLAMSQEDGEGIAPRLLALISATGEDGITKSDLVRRSQWAEVSERMTAMGYLIGSGSVVESRVTGKTKAMTRYHCVQYSPEGVEGIEYASEERDAIEKGIAFAQRIKERAEQARG